jgi:hypothetical protein
LEASARFILQLTAGGGGGEETYSLKGGALALTFWCWALGSANPSKTPGILKF